MVEHLSQGRRPYLLLLALALMFFLPGLVNLPPIDRDESRFAQASRQMLESGDFVRINFQAESRAKKPVGIYWMQAASAGLTQAESAIWAYRLPSVLGALAAVVFTFHFGRRLFGAPAALTGAALLTASLILIAEAHQAKTDAMLLACITAAQGVLGQFYLAQSGGNCRRPGQSAILLFWLAQGIGILIKGPIVPLISLLTLASLWAADRRIRWLTGIRPFSGMLLVAAIVAPWFAAVTSATQGQFIGQAVKSDLLPKLLGAQESHGAPPGYFLLLATATLWPAAMFAFPGLIRAFQTRQAASLRFCLAWILPAWLLFELVPTKLPHYILPTYPPLALLAGLIVTTGDDILKSGWARLFYCLSAAVGLLLAGGAMILPLLYGDGPGWFAGLAACGALIAAIAPAVLAWRQKYQGAVVAAIGGALLCFGCIYQGVLPQLDSLWLSQRVVAHLEPGTPLVAAGFHEPSLVFLGGTATLLTDGKSAAHFLATTPKAVAVVEAEALADFSAEMTALGHPVQQIAQVNGYNYSRGRTARLSLWRE